MSRPRRFARAPGLHAERIGDEELLVDPTRRVAAHLNTSAALVWRLCDGARSDDEIVDLLRAAYPDQADQIEAQARDALARLAAAGLLVDRTGG